MAKSRVYSFRISEELGQMFDQLKASQAHPRVPTAELLVEAFRLYVELGKRYGLDDAVKVKLPKSLQIVPPPNSLLPPKKAGSSSPR
jgi:hypothetical protein